MSVTNLALKIIAKNLFDARVENKIASRFGIKITSVSAHLCFLLHMLTQLVTAAIYVCMVNNSKVLQTFRYAGKLVSRSQIAIFFFLHLDGFYFFPSKCKKEKCNQA